ncbi:DUF3221 domain-containing protein [Paenibacillus melissococcoides]|uniref:DUF3221 domain-containing protein n=1 Tax=Paenibacillus melissococcoides TaxID=2912268 RepID=A0ABN8UA22_9BACL|nr:MULTISPECIES: DUF3221 domain-containing protein [Paenibacillus]MEB9897044.1 DUF3221 domain-containing protein [Bacillus cereus]CAH8247981.1 DUF3221 domain-containing protein [Paenibacillus melissococcoides]CAH8718966.1 DUF3221 domain-containing protein [Paenibacillus melissococcoides]CAH8719973.1 DUF3221 domain-containing protein [Paenibacillus melissococcoides]GIO80679.1 DUF3221 domain-containing protein [Paenibacillus dendritiformis]
MITKKKLVVGVLALSLGLGFTAGVTPTFAHADESASMRIAGSAIEEQELVPFTGYVISIGGTYMTIANAPTKEEALQGEWWELVNQGKILLVPSPENEAYAVGDKVNEAMTMSLPPIAISPILEKITE